MNYKSILISSICIPAILIITSFTTVAEYQSNSTNITAASPLFTIRSNRAIDEESKDIVSDYIGKGKKILFKLPSLNNRNRRLQKVIDRIIMMDDKTFKSFLNLIINEIRNNDKYDEVNINEVITTIQQIRNNLKTIILDESKNNISTIGHDFTPTVCWFPGCIPFILITISIITLYTIFAIFATIIFALLLEKYWTADYVYCYTNFLPC